MNSLFIQPLDKGQITIPALIRRKLGIDKNTILKLEVRDKDRQLIIQPMAIDWKNKYIREYQDKEIKEFYKLDKLDKKTRSKIAKYLGL